jgi:hypothetical protein
VEHFSAPFVGARDKIATNRRKHYHTISSPTGRKFDAFETLLINIVSWTGSGRVARTVSQSCVLRGG